MMKNENLLKRLGKKQRYLLKYLTFDSIDYESAQKISHITGGLKPFDLVAFSNQQLILAEKGVELIEGYAEQLFTDIPESKEEISSYIFKIKPEKTPKLKTREHLFLAFLNDSSRPISEIRLAKNIIPILTEKLLIEDKEGILSLTEEGKKVLSESTRDISNENPIEVFLSAGRIESRRALNDKAEIFLSLYREGLTYQEIGDLYELTRERVRQILNKTPNFQQYLAEYEIAKAERELREDKEIRLRNIERSLGTQFPDRIDELWDWEKNGDLNPAEIPAHSLSYEIWFRCPKDNHSWKKKPGDIVTSCERSGTSGCPACVGKINKAQKQPSLAETYPALVKEYWDFEKNSADNLDPDEVTLGSNRKANFKCPIDGNEWQSQIAATVKQQWSNDNAGCRVCNGTANRKDGVWGEALPIGEKFPEQVATYWNFERNESIGVDPAIITSGSSKEAWFRCPIDNYEWQARIAPIGNSWKRGNSGCPQCRGFIARESNSLSALYPQFVALFWNFEKNLQSGIILENMTCGKHIDAWFKCPEDETEWNSKVNSIVSGYWKYNKSGCPTCGKGRQARKVLDY